MNTPRGYNPVGDFCRATMRPFRVMCPANIRRSAARTIRREAPATEIRDFRPVSAFGPGASSWLLRSI
jgi:hypothetical protein